MKVCSVCSARCFDDMEVCYGCMHRFGKEGEERSGSAALDPTMADSVSGLSKACGEALPTSASPSSQATEGLVSALVSDPVEVRLSEEACARWELVVSLWPVRRNAVDGADC